MNTFSGTNLKGFLYPSYLLILSLAPPRLPIRQKRQSKMVDLACFLLFLKVKLIELVQKEGFE